MGFLKVLSTNGVIASYVLTPQQTSLETMLKNLKRLETLDYFTKLYAFVSRYNDSRIEVRDAPEPAIIAKGVTYLGFEARNAKVRQCEEGEQLIPLINEEGEMTGVAKKYEVHKLGELHPAFSVYLFDVDKNGNLMILLQQRAIKKYHSALEWANACCSHPRVDESSGKIEIESMVYSAEKRTVEELGINSKLTLVGQFIYKSVFENFCKIRGSRIEHEFDHVLVGRDSSSVIKFNEKEVHDYQWVKCEDLLSQLREGDMKFVTWFIPSLKIALEGLVSIQLRQSV